MNVLNQTKQEITQNFFFTKDIALASSRAVGYLSTGCPKRLIETTPLIS